MSSTKPPFLTDRMYDILQWIVRVLMPATATLIAALGVTLEWEPATVVVAVLGAVTLFLGTILGVNSKRYAASDEHGVAPLVGEIGITEGDDKKLYDLKLDVPPESIDTLTQVSFRVNGPS